MVDESLQERRYVAGYSMRIDIVAVTQRGKNLTDPAGLCEHLPNLACRGIKVEIGAGPQTQKSAAAVEVGSDRLAVLNKNAFDSDSQARQTLQSCATGKSYPKPSGCWKFSPQLAARRHRVVASDIDLFMAAV